MFDFPILKKAVELDFNSFFLKIWDNKSVQVYIEILNKEQLSRSIDSNSVQLSYEDAKGNIRTGYSPLTAKLSKGRKKVGDSFNLRDTGEFYKSIKAMPELKGFEITADYQKDDTKLNEKFGEAIIGLTDESIQKLQEFIKPIIFLNIRKELGLI